MPAKGCLVTHPKYADDAPSSDWSRSVEEVGAGGFVALRSGLPSAFQSTCNSGPGAAARPSAYACSNFCSNCWLIFGKR